jgi:CHAD domain-containing protein
VRAIPWRARPPAMSRTRHSVARAYQGLAEQLFEKAAAACQRLQRDDPEALHDFRVALRRLRTHLATHADHLGSRDAEYFRKRLADLVAATNTSRDQEVQRKWIARQMASDDLSAVQRDGLALILNEFYGNDSNGTARPELRPIAEDFAALGEKFRERRWSMAEPGHAKETSQRSIASVTKHALLKHTRKLRKHLGRMDSVDAVEPTHRARLAVKRLRYTLEPLGKLISGGRDIIAELKALQDALGSLRDMQILHLQVALAAGVATAVPGPGGGASLEPEIASGGPLPLGLDDEDQKTLDAGLDRVRVEAQRQFTRIQERWLSGDAIALVTRIEELAKAL